MSSEKTHRNYTKVIRFAGVFLCSLIVTPLTSHAAVNVDWYYANMESEDYDEKNSVNDDPTKVSIKGGWSCGIGKTAVMTITEIRRTICQKDKGIFEFSVECGKKKSNGNTVVSFRSSRGRVVDLLRVECEVTQ